MYFRAHSTWKKAKLQPVPMNNDLFKKPEFQSTDDREKKKQTIEQKMAQWKSVHKCECVGGVK